MHNVYLRSWLDLRGLPVTLPKQGRQVGTVEDFYFDPESNAVYALRVKLPLTGYVALLSSVIDGIKQDAVTIANEQRLSNERHDGRLPVLLLGQNLLSYNVISEDGNPVGRVADILLDTRRHRALAVVAYQLAGGRTFSSNEVTTYGQGVIVLLNQIAKKL